MRQATHGQIRQATDREIRAHLGHNTGNRRVKISRDGRVTYYGSTDDIDRNHDYWHNCGRIEDYCYDDYFNEIPR